MANLTGLDIVTTVRFMANENSPSGRFADSEIYNYVNMATIQVMLRVKWPEATYTWISDGINAGPGTEIPLPEMHSVLRVYVAGQLCIPTTIALLQGDGIGTHDQSGTNYAPRWMVAPFTGYPVASSMSSPSDASVPYFQGQRPSFYFRTGALGIAPPPVSGYKISMDVYPAPNTLGAPTDATFFPQIFKEAIAMRTLAYMYFADSSDANNTRSMQCIQQYENQVTQVILPWKDEFSKNLPNKPMPVPHRTYFQGPMRGPTGRSSRFGG